MSEPTMTKEEIAVLRDFLNRPGGTPLSAQLLRLLATLDASAAREASLRALLAKHGHHLDNCNFILGWGDDCLCDCGLDAALKEGGGK